ncbi:hypothetical protein BD309DRAFT_352600 [Dichomitus squalens]|uniref:Uncharacterized protein n=1 Tax=Dichomitus squalens TaxID=114155 RepID=A0A4Q9NHX1_9APHY|nr:hypothetical protein BD309DRAFT_352600 [Dichomitus squalens]TBU53262.1 hypothetical protein BD310DRAFT_164560 [Dichomitus squalens]
MRRTPRPTSMQVQQPVRGRQPQPHLSRVEPALPRAPPQRRTQVHRERRDRRRGRARERPRERPHPRARPRSRRRPRGGRRRGRRGQARDGGADEAHLRAPRARARLQERELLLELLQRRLLDRPPRPSRPLALLPLPLPVAAVHAQGQDGRRWQGAPEAVVCEVGGRRRRGDVHRERVPVAHHGGRGGYGRARQGLVRTVLAAAGVSEELLLVRVRDPEVVVAAAAAVRLLDSARLPGVRELDVGRWGVSVVSAVVPCPRPPGIACPGNGLGERPLQRGDLALDIVPPLTSPLSRAARAAAVRRPRCSRWGRGVCARVEWPCGELLFAQLPPEAVVDHEAPNEQGQEEGAERAAGSGEHDGVARVVAARNLVSRMTLFTVGVSLQVSGTRWPAPRTSIRTRRTGA